MYEELKEHGFTVITVALDRNAEDARPWIEVAAPSHPSLIDVRHHVADLYNMVNVPTVVWIDEQGRIVRPNDVAYGNNAWKDVHGFDADVHKDALRNWVTGITPEPYAPERARELQEQTGHLPDAAHQEARAEFALGQWLWEDGRMEAADPHFERAGELAPHDFTIRRGSMLMRGKDPMGEEFFAMAGAWAAAGRDYYRPLPEA